MPEKAPYLGMPTKCWRPSLVDFDDPEFPKHEAFEDKSFQIDCAILMHRMNRDRFLSCRLVFERLDPEVRFELLRRRMNDYGDEDLGPGFDSDQG